MLIERETCCVYTTLIGGYEQLNEQPATAQSNLRFICLTDDPSLRSASWECRLVEPVFARDPVRSQRDMKIRPHVHMPEFRCSLYIDNSVILKQPPETLLRLADPTVSLMMAPHSFRDTVLDEFIEVARLNLDDETRVFEQLNHYLLTYPDVLKERPWWGAIMVRDHGSARVQAMAEFWAAHVLRYSRRDQLSVNLAMQVTGIQPARLDIDNNDSEFHSWPHGRGRERVADARHHAASLMPAAARVRQLEQLLAAHQNEIAALREHAGHQAAELELLRSETARPQTEPIRSWRPANPLNWFRKS